MTSGQFVQSLIEEVIDRFKASGYPDRSFNLSGKKDLEVCIRIPPHTPEFLERKYEEYRDRFKACPSIERLEIPKNLRNQGFFSGLVSALGSLPDVEAVCVAHVTNPTFAEFLAKSDEWQEFGYNDYLQLGPLVSTLVQANKTAPSFYRRFPKN